MIGGSNIIKGVRNDIFADTQSDVEDLEQFAIDNQLSQGSACIVIATGDVYILQSNGTWVKQ